MDKKTKMIAKASPRKATLRSCRSTMERIKIEMEIIFTLGSHECKGDLRWANLSISGRCILLFNLPFFAKKIQDDPHNAEDVANPTYHFCKGYFALLRLSQLSHNRL
ncbi:hypothetical protein ES702_05998 [subsurface metagenome]